MTSTERNAVRMKRLKARVEPLKIYDIMIDEFRVLTQADLDQLHNVSAAYVLQRLGNEAIARFCASVAKREIPNCSLQYMFATIAGSETKALSELAEKLAKPSDRAAFNALKSLELDEAVNEGKF